MGSICISIGRPLKVPSITNRLVAIVHTEPVIAIFVPKLIAITQRWAQLARFLINYN